MAQTVIRAAESTENIPSTRRVRDVDAQVAYLDPSETPFTLLISKSGTKAVVNSKFEWIEKDLPEKWIHLNEALDTTETVITVDTPGGDYASVGDLILVAETGEVVRVATVDSATQLTVVRAVNGDKINGSSAADDGDLLIIGNAYAEGTTSPDEKSHVETMPYNFTQISKKPFGVTGTEDASENYTGKDRVRLRKEKGIEHALDLERTALFGKRNIDTASTNNPRRYTGGFFDFCDTESNVKDAGGTLTEAELEDWLEDVFTHTGSGNSRLLLAAPKVISVFDQLGLARLQTVPTTETYGIAVKQYLTSHGTLNIVKHRLLVNGEGGFGYGNTAIAVDISKLTRAPLQGRDTKLQPDIGANDLDGFKDQYLSEVGWKIKNPKVHGILSNVLR